MLTFMSAYSGYNQIRMHSRDDKKAFFVTERGLYCYQVMPFSPNKVGAIYQRLVNKMFHDQIGKTMAIYIFDNRKKNKTTTTTTTVTPRLPEHGG